MSDAFVADKLLQQINPFHDAGIVDQYIEHAIAVANGLDQRQHIRPHRDVASNRLDRRVFCLQLTKCHVIASAGDDLATLGRKMDCELPTDPRRATRHHNDAVAPGTASRTRISHSSIGASSSGPCSLQFQLDSPELRLNHRFAAYPKPDVGCVLGRVKPETTESPTAPEPVKSASRRLRQL